LALESNRNLERRGSPKRLLHRRQRTQSPIRYILSYALPHRGFATSGDRPVEGPNLLYWKSNPYLVSKFTGESDSLHAQWIIVDLQSEKQINAARIQWASPYAKTFQVEYWVGTNALDFDGGPKGEWKVFNSGKISNGKGEQQHSFSPAGPSPPATSAS